MKKGENTKIARLEKYLFDKYDLRINIITNDLESKLKEEKVFSLLNLADIHYELSHAGFTRYREDLNTLFASSEIERFDPFKDYFESLKKYNPSTDPDYILELTSFIETDNQKWFKIAFKKFLVQMAGQCLAYIEFNKHCLTLVGRQHDGKTTFLEWLIPLRLQ
jgi:predicted P-loop ATPase